MPGTRRVSNERNENTKLGAPDKKKLIHRDRAMTIRKETLLMLLLTAVAACAVHAGGTQVEDSSFNKPHIKRSYKEDYPQKVPKTKPTKENKSFEKTYDWTEDEKANLKKKFAGNRRNTKKPISAPTPKVKEEECDSWFSCNEDQIKQIVKNLVFTGAMLALLPVIAVFSQVADRMKNGPRDHSKVENDQDDSPDPDEEDTPDYAYSKTVKAPRRKRARFCTK